MHKAIQENHVLLDTSKVSESNFPSFFFFYGSFKNHAIDKKKSLGKYSEASNWFVLPLFSKQTYVVKEMMISKNGSSLQKF